LFTVINCLTDQHDIRLVAIAFTIALLGMMCYFQLLVRAEECTASRKSVWIFISSVSGGLSVWATHFVAMLAYNGAQPIGFDLWVTLLSAGISIGGFWVSSIQIGAAKLREFERALLIALTIAAMHFTGMLGIKVAADIAYDWALIAWGSLVSVCLIWTSIVVFNRKLGKVYLETATLLLVLALCALHFTAMAATTIVPNPSLPDVASEYAYNPWLAFMVATAALFVISMTVIAVSIDRLLVDMRGFADATLDGIAVLRDGKIIDANRRFREMLELTDVVLKTVAPSDLMYAADGQAIEAPRLMAIEAYPLIGNTSRVFELGVRTIEYRGRSCEVVAIRDLTEKRNAQRRIEYLARHDALTGLPNRVLFEERLGEALRDDPGQQKRFSLLALDLDRFKAVNDLFGHAEGDRVLKKVATMLRACAGPADTVARLGGDEFCILTANDCELNAAQALATNILRVFATEMDFAANPTAVGVSIGIATYPSDAQSADALCHAADLALYRAKVAGKGTYALYDNALDLETRKRRQLENDLRQAIARDELYLVYQPIHCIETQTIAGYEALLRWKHPSGELIAPDLFIPLAEETGIILAIGEWVLRQACRAAADWEPHYKIAINISAVQFQLPNLALTVASILHETGLAPSRLELEITETSLLKERSRTLETLNQLKNLGVGIVMDDFGTGYSSLSNIQSFAFDKIKIDRSFVSAMHHDKNARAIIRAVIGLGKSLSLPVTAEGVETLDQYKMIVDEGCAHAQGYLVGKPDVGPHGEERRLAFNEA
jgi:diguanylate cyclase (GGDEF)-like protein